jgi:hypothetical protein
MARIRSSAQEIGARRRGFQANSPLSGHSNPSGLSRLRISFVALCVELDTDEDRRNRRAGKIELYGCPRAASFLRHKL